MTKIIVRLLFFIILIDFTIVNSITAGNQLSRQAKLKVSRINLKGNITFSTEELSTLTAPCENREITIQELEELRKKITHYYTDRGYINSGVIIQDQDVADGVINFIIIEGGITATEVTGNDWLHKRYILSRLESAIKQEGKAFNINLLEKRLKLLKQDKLIENINAVISPGLKFGEANLNLEIDEARPYQISLKYNNHGSPGIGSYRGEIALAHYNLTGCLGDSLELNYKETEGFDDYSVNYTIPLTRFDTTLGFNYSKSASTVVSYPFNMLNIKSETETFGASLRHPFYKTLSREFAAGLSLEKHHNKTFLLGLPYSFTTHQDDYETNVTELSFSQEWVSRSMTQVLALRSDFKFGLDWFNATIHKGLDNSGKEYADSKYITWLGQLQWFRRLEVLNSSLLFKTNLQLTNDPQLSSGKFSIGGNSTVIGYRENQMTTDNGVVSSLEWSIPVFQLKLPMLSRSENDGQVWFCPFFDYGRGWNVSGDAPVPKELYSLGAGLRWSISKNINTKIYYGHSLIKIKASNEYDLQDDGIHFGITVNLF